MNKENLVEQLNSRNKNERISALKNLRDIVPQRSKTKGHTNNHVHSKYSFSPYTPTRIVYEAYIAGLATVGIMDHDSLAGAKEFIEAGEIFGITTTIGFEIRTDWLATQFNSKIINNPDQSGCGYICVHGVPHQKIDEVEAYLAKVRDARNERNKVMIARINALVKRVALDFEKDVVPVSFAHDGGSITERHILYALTLKLVSEFGKGKGLIDYLSNMLNIVLTDVQHAYLLDVAYEYYEYDVLNILKISFVKPIYIAAKQPETPVIDDLVEFCHSMGCVVAYGYLGDVSKSITGDKKEQVFEDGYLDELFDFIKKLQFDAVAFMPSRNTKAQLKRVMSLCDQYGFFQISGEDINQPRQAFVCKQLMDDDYKHLITSTWALVGHEMSASKAIDKGMFAGANKMRDLKEKLPEFAKIGRQYEK